MHHIVLIGKKLTKLPEFFHKIIYSNCRTLYNLSRFVSENTKIDLKMEKSPLVIQNKPYQILKYSVENEEYVLNKALEVLRSNQVLALPTDTIYGIATLAQNAKAVQSLYSIKERNPNKPIAICVGEISDIPKWSNVCVSSDILEGLLPGPVTLVFNSSANLNPLLIPETGLIGIRIPKYSFVQKLAKHCGEPLALTSANISCQESANTIEGFSDLWSKLGLIIDGGSLGHLDPLKLGSTVVDLSKEGYFKILRPGCAKNSTRQFLTTHNFLEI